MLEEGDITTWSRHHPPLLNWYTNEHEPSQQDDGQTGSREQT